MVMDPKTQEKLVQSLLKSLVQLRETKGKIRIEDLGKVMDQLAASIQSQESDSSVFLRSEFQKIAEHISKAREEIISLVPATDESPENIGHASNQLDAVVKMTEEASNSIMDAADEIQQAVDNNDPNMKEIITDAVAKIFMSCNFQDITGQRITKVMNTLQYVDEKISNILELFAEMNLEAAQNDTKNNGNNDSSSPKNRKEEEAQGLLSGPALPENANTQEDIDALFADI